VFPHFGQVVDVGLKLLVGGGFGVGAGALGWGFFMPLILYAGGCSVR